MTIFIGHLSALQFLLSNGTPQRRVLGACNVSLKPTRACPRPGKTPNPNIIRELGIPDGIITRPLHVNVADAASRSQSRQMISHVWTGSVRHTYLRIDDEYCVLTPEAAFVQMAPFLTFPHLVELGMTLCGTYAPAPEGLAVRYDMEPLTCADSLRSYASSLKNVRGASRARTASLYVRDGSGSIYESKYATVFSLSTRYGGLGRPPQLNAELSLSDKVRGGDPHATRRPDFLWPNYHAAADYDGHESHDAPHQIEADRVRRNELAALGLKSMVLRSYNHRDLSTFLSTLEQIEEILGVQRPSATKNLYDKRVDLYRQLFGLEQWNPMDASTF